MESGRARFAHRPTPVHATGNSVDRCLLNPAIIVVLEAQLLSCLARISGCRLGGGFSTRTERPKWIALPDRDCFPIGCNWAGVAELADAADSKSAAGHPAWGFNSPLQHQSNPCRINWIQTDFFSCALGVPAGQCLCPTSCAHRLPAAPVSSEPTGHNASR